MSAYPSDVFPILLTYKKTFKDGTLKDVTITQCLNFISREGAKLWLAKTRRKIKDGRLSFALSEPVIIERK